MTGPLGYFTYASNRKVDTLSTKADKIGNRFIEKILDHKYGKLEDGLKQEIENGNKAHVKKLLKNNPQLANKPDQNTGAYPLQIAIQYEDWEISELLIDALKIDISSKKQLQAYQSAYSELYIHGQNNLALKLYYKGCFKNTVYHLSVLKVLDKAYDAEDHKTCHNLLALLDISSFENYSSLLQLAAKKELWLAIAFLIKSKPPTNPDLLKETYNYAKLAIEKNQLKLLEVLLSVGICPNSPIDEFKNTLLHHAVLANKPKMIKLLMQSSGDPSLVNKAGETASSLANQLGHRKCQRALNKSPIEEPNPITSHLTELSFLNQPQSSSEVNTSICSPY